METLLLASARDPLWLRNGQRASEEPTLSQHLDSSLRTRKARRAGLSNSALSWFSAFMAAVAGGACSSGETGANAGSGGSGGSELGMGGQAANTGGNATGGLLSSGGSLATGGRATSGGATTLGGSAGAANASGAGGASADGGSATAGGGAGGNAQGGASGKAGQGAQSGSAGAIAVPSGYKLVWHDEFDVDGAPNPANWKFEKGFVRNEEAQWYQSNNASVQGGMLVIEARKEQVQNPNYTGKGDWKTTRQTAEYTSSSLHTSGLQSWQYGRFEMRGRIPTKAGMWPAWWTLGVSGEWPSNGEVDIMEFYQGKVLANVACGTSTRYSAKWDSQTKQISTLGANWASEFHLWRMDWDDQQIVLYLDDQELNTSSLQSMLNADGTSPFKQKEYMLVNVAIGGMNGGDPSGTSFPQRFEVDYVRVFQKQ
jgi:beta-glucanase (GH16 family)